MSSPSGKGLEGAARVTASRFLQSVVVVDDRALLGDRSEPPIARPGSVQDKGSGSTGKLVTPAAANYVEDDRHDLNAKEVVDQFASLGLVCAVLKPVEPEDPGPATVAAASRADIVILDWYLNKIVGDTTLDLIDAVIKADEATGGVSRLRLVVIYTGESNLRQITTRVRHRLEKHYPGAKTSRPNPFTVVRGPVRVSVFAKSGARISQHLTELRRRRVATQELPDRVINEFAVMTAGLVPGVALESVAAIRANTHKLLARMSPDLDPAYLFHRAMQSNPPDAEEHLIELVAGEIWAILEDSPAATSANMDRIKDWLEANKAGADLNIDFDGTTLKLSHVVDLLDKGIANARVQSLFGKFGKKPPLSMKAFGESTASTERANLAFAVLAALKTQYMRPPPHLTLGTVLSRRSGARRQFLVCVQPRCDSVRLSGKQQFPLLPVNVAEPNKPFDLVIPDGLGRWLTRPSKYVRLRMVTQPAKLVMVTFPVTSGDDSVVAQPRSKRFRFMAEGHHAFWWAGQLKAEHAQRLATVVGNEFSRVGLTESEWLRRWN